MCSGPARSNCATGLARVRRRSSSYPTERMTTLYGFIGLAIFIPCVISLAASVTWLVVKLSPNPEKKKTAAEA